MGCTENNNYNTYNGPNYYNQPIPVQTNITISNYFFKYLSLYALHISICCNISQGEQESDTGLGQQEISPYHWAFSPNTSLGLS